MAHQLKMAVVNAILILTQLGWSQRRIAQVLGIDRETVARYVHAPPAAVEPPPGPRCSLRSSRPLGDTASLGCPLISMNHTNVHRICDSVH